MTDRSTTPSDDEIARRNYVLFCGAATLLLGVLVLFTVLYLG